MTNRLLHVQIQDVRLDPLESEVVISAFPERVTATTELRGRLVGPRTAYARTLEVAHPLRVCPRQPPGEPGLAGRIVFPEPCFWDPESPFLYEGFVELWEEGQLVERAELRHGLRRRGLGPRGVRWNGRVLSLRGVARSMLTPDDAAELRQAGCNVLVAPVAATEMWEVADRLGFLMLGRVADLVELERLACLRSHPCVLGWVLEPSITAARTLPDAWLLEAPVAEDAPRELALCKHL